MLFFCFLVSLFFLLSNQPFQIVILLIALVVSSLPSLHFFVIYHWVDYVFLIVYLGGLLVLFLYFTSFISNFLNNLNLSLPIVFLLFFFFLFLENESGFFSNGSSGLFLFSFPLFNPILLSVFFLLIFIFLFISFSLNEYLPIREV